MSDMALKDFIATHHWMPHTHQEGSRRHVLMWGGLAIGDVTTVVCWCSEPYCENNRAQVQALVREGLDPAFCFPPPRLRQELEDLHFGQAA